MTSALVRALFALAVPVSIVVSAGCDRAGTPPPASADRPPETTSLHELAEVFADATETSGLDFVHFNGMTGEFYIAEVMGAGVALLDYDNDGDLDLYLNQGTLLGVGKTLDDALVPPRHPSPLTDRLYRNDLSRGADGAPVVRWVDVTESAKLAATGYGMGVAAADYDNDGWVDLYVTNFGENQLWRNNGDGTFSDVTELSGASDSRFSVPAVFFDYDHDGWLDLFVGNYVDFRIANHRVCETATGRADWCGPLAYDPAPDRLYRNRGDGTFEDVTERAGIARPLGNALGAIPADFNLDGRIDLYVANDAMPNRLWINRGDGTFRDEGLGAGCAVNADGQPEASMGVDAGDCDRDGDEDLFMTHLRRETNTIYINQGDGTFRDATVRSGLGPGSLAYTGFGAAWLDYDNDAWLDLLTVNGAVMSIDALAERGDPFPLHQRNQLFHATGAATFEEVGERAGTAFGLSEVSRGAAFGDVDNDGDVDVVVSNNSGPARLLLNQVGHHRSWVGLRLLERSGTRDALGAWVGVRVPGSPTLWRRCRTAGSYVSANDPRILVGLGDATAVDAVEVWWPDASREAFDGLPVNRYTTLRAGTGRPLGP